MKLKFLIVSALVASICLSCASSSVDDSSSEESGASSDLDLGSEENATDIASSEPEAEQPTPPPDEENQVASNDDFDLEKEVAEQKMVEEPAPAPTEPMADPIVEAPVQPPENQVATESFPEAPPADTNNAIGPVTLTGVKFKANDNGGTVVLEATGPVQYKTRTNPDTKQFIVEMENVTVPAKFKRTLNTKDIEGAIGSVDIYQNSGGSTARLVLQMREGFSNPMVQQEGNSLLVVSSGNTIIHHDEVASDNDAEIPMDKILTSQSLSDFLAGNTKFYGKKISIEMNEDMDIKDALHFITEETGLNMVIAEEVKGKVRLKLRQVPWDQALVVLMRAKKLGYTRQGSVLRIAPIEELKAEEDEATKLAVAKKVIEPLKVKMFPINYAKVDELASKIKEFLTEGRGKVVGDSRTNALVVTDTEETLKRVAKLITSLDIQPPQVLIEGKIVEAQETFARSIGINWGLNGINRGFGAIDGQPVNLSSNLSVNSGAGSGGNLGFDLSLGSLGMLGNLSAALALTENEGKLKVLSSPRIVALTNETAKISQTIQVPVRTATVSNGVQQISYAYKDLALKFEVTPQVSSDGAVIMKVNVNREFKGPSRIEQGIETFDVNARAADTRVLVKNGQTAVIGGVYQSDATTAVKKVPWLGDIPVLGWLFKTDAVDRSKNELLIFLTPRILANAESVGPATKEQEF
ncbi:MAG: type IV pilus secretin PilQ [Pseudobdellovibrionaceae bacterium]